MDICCATKTISRWRNVWSIKWRVPGQEVNQKKLERDSGKGCQARKLNSEDAMDRSGWRKQIMHDWWPRWVWVSEFFFWYRLTQVVPDKLQRAVKRLCVCVCVCVCVWGSSTVAAYGKSFLAMAARRSLSTSSDCSMTIWLLLFVLTACTQMPSRLKPESNSVAYWLLLCLHFSSVQC